MTGHKNVIRFNRLSPGDMVHLRRHHASNTLSSPSYYWGVFIYCMHDWVFEEADAMDIYNCTEDSCLSSEFGLIVGERSLKIQPLAFWAGESTVCHLLAHHSNNPFDCSPFQNLSKQLAVLPITPHLEKCSVQCTVFLYHGICTFSVQAHKSSSIFRTTWRMHCLLLLKKWMFGVQYSIHLRN